MTSLVDYLDYIMQKAKATKKVQPVHCPRMTGKSRFKERLFRQIQLDQRSSRLKLTSSNDGGLDVRADGTGGGAEGLNLLHDLHGVLVSNLAEDDVLAIEPRGDNGGDEELGAVAREGIQVSKGNSGISAIQLTEPRDLRVGTSVGHGEQTGAGVLVDEVLIGELLAVDGATTGTLFRIGRLETTPWDKRAGQEDSRCDG